MPNLLPLRAVQLSSQPDIDQNGLIRFEKLREVILWEKEGGLDRFVGRIECQFPLLLPRRLLDCQ
jgi:hypothetical protein